MKIPKNVTNKWKQLYDIGDIKKICEENKIDPRKVSKGIKGECEPEVFTAISTFYNQKQNLLKTA